jgi:hypothetical protein
LALRGKLVWDDSDEGWAKDAKERATNGHAAKVLLHRAPKVATRTRKTA